MTLTGHSTEPGCEVHHSAPTLPPIDTRLDLLGPPEQNTAASPSPSPSLRESADHVLQTYAQLSLTGVPRDGFAEGNDVTRERRIPSISSARWVDLVTKSTKRWSVADEYQAFKVLKACDRYGFFTPSQNPYHRICKLPQKAFSTLPRLPGKISTGLRPPFNYPQLHHRRSTSDFSMEESQSSNSFSRQNSRSSAGDEDDPAASNKPDHTQQQDQQQSSADNHASKDRRKKEDERVKKWAEMLCVSYRDSGGNSLDWEFIPKYRTKRLEKLRRRVYKGIPDRWRRAAWGALIDLMSMQASTNDQCPQHVETSSCRNCSLTGYQLQKQLATYLKESSMCDVQIDLDVPRTISNHILFHTRYGQGQRSLFQVLHGLSLVCTSCGYVQGMGPIAATLLCYFEAERAFASFVRLHDNYGLHRIFVPGFPGLHQVFYVQEKLVAWLMPDVSAVLELHGIHISSYATKWYITLYANVVPFETQLRIWDAFLLDGMNVLILTGVAILWGLRERICDKDASFESILTTLTSSIIVESNDSLLFWVMKVLNEDLVHKRIAEWAEEWDRDNKDDKKETKETKNNPSGLLGK